MRALIQKVDRSMGRLVRPGTPGLVAFSGGPDSLALLLVLARLKRWSSGLVVAHVDHALRPESALEVKKLEAFAQQLGLAFASERVCVSGPDGVEGNARRERYRTLERMATSAGLDWIATGHTASDQAETVLMRLARGTAGRGMRGILPRRGRVVRPLLEVSRTEVSRFLADVGQSALIDDPSNRDLGRARNRVRHSVLPELRKAYPGADEALARYAKLASDDWNALQSLIPTRSSLPLRDLSGLPESVRCRWVQAQAEAVDVRLSSGELAAASAAIRRGHRQEVGLGRRLLLCISDQVQLMPLPPHRADRGMAAIEERPQPWGAWLFQLEPRAAKPVGDQPLGCQRLAIPSGTPTPICVRARRPGDRLQAPDGTHRSLKKVMIDQGVPRHLRAEVPVVIDGAGRILWVVGVWAIEGQDPSKPGSWAVHAWPRGDVAEAVARS